MSLSLTRPAAGAALLAVLAGCGTAAAAHAHGPAMQNAATAPAMAHGHHAGPVNAGATPATAPPATARAHPTNPIPQGNGGDQDVDNNGGPSDGDGSI